MCICYICSMFSKLYTRNLCTKCCVFVICVACALNCVPGTCDEHSGSCTCQDGYYGSDCRNSKWTFLVLLYITLLCCCNWAQVTAHLVVVLLLPWCDIWCDVWCHITVLKQLGNVSNILHSPSTRYPQTSQLDDPRVVLVHHWNFNWKAHFYFFDHYNLAIVWTFKV